MDEVEKWTRHFRLMAAGKLHKEELGRKLVRNIKSMIENIIPAQLDAFSTVARHIVESRIQIMDIDSDYFRRRRRILKVIAKPTLPFRRKRRRLLSLIHKLIRTTY